MKKSDLLKREASDLLDQCEQRLAAAESTGRDLTAAEQASWNGTMDQVKALHEQADEAAENGTQPSVGACGESLVSTGRRATPRTAASIAATTCGLSLVR